MINFPTTPYQNMHQFNEDFEKAVSALQEEWLGRNIKELSATDEDFQPIVELLNNNTSLLSRNNDIEEVSRFIKTSYQIPVWINKNLHQGHDVLTNIIIKSSLAILHLSKERIPESIDILKSLQTTNETLFLDVLANWINEEKIPLKKLGDLKLIDEQLIQIAPRLNHLDFTGTKYSEDFIVKLFEKSEKVKCIIFKNNMISGSCFNFLKNTKSLEIIIIDDCGNFNQELPDNLPSLLILNINRCYAFNQQLPNNLPSLLTLEISDCMAFDQKLPDNLPSLHLLEISDCRAFDQKLPDKLSSLLILKINKCYAFDLKLPNNLPSLQELEISDCIAFDQKLPDNLPSLRALKISECIAFDQKLPDNLPSLQDLVINRCKAFDQKLPDNLPSLRTLKISVCIAFDQKLPDNLPSLQGLVIHRCDAFNQKLSDNLPSLQELEISECVAFNQQLPDNLPSLQKLEISWCKAFNQKLPDNLPSLLTLTMRMAEKFNQQLPNNLPSLQVLVIDRCIAFNQKLPDNLPSLKKLNVDCKNFNPFSHDVKTALLLSQFDLKQFKQMWGSLTPQIKQQKVQEVINARDFIKSLFDKAPEKLLNVAKAFEIPLESFKQAYPEEISYFILIYIDKERTQGGSDEAILALFNSLKDQSNYLETLKKMLRLFPSLTSFILRKNKDEFLMDIENSQISITELPSETKWSLLPLLKADDIAQMIHLTSKGERAEWLQEQLHFDRFSGSVASVLKSIKEANIDRSTTQRMENLTTTMLELLQMIPFKTLAALTFDDQNLKTILAYLPFMDEQQLAVVIPVLPQKVFMDYLDKQLLNMHPDKLMHATQPQKELYLEKRVIEHFVLSLKDRLTTFKHVMETNQTPENEEKLGQDFNILHASITQQLNSIPKILNRMKEVLLKGSPTEDFRHNVETYSKEISSMMTSIGNEMLEINNKIDSKKEAIPEEFIDEISGEIMTEPYRDELTGNILDKQTWDQMKGINPFNRQATTLVEDRDLKEKIQKYLTDKELEKK